MKIYLVEPGENDSFALTQKGVWQIKTTARRFITEKTHIDRVYVNGNSISRQSGNILGKSLTVPIISDESFSEISKKVVEGNLSDKDFENLNYFNIFIEDIVSKGRDVLITIGGGIHRAVISRLTGMPLVETRHFMIGHSSITLIEFEEVGVTGKWRISKLNDINHLVIP